MKMVARTIGAKMGMGGSAGVKFGGNFTADVAGSVGDSVGAVGFCLSVIRSSTVHLAQLDSSRSLSN
jgi:hypothetical protein